MVANLVKLRFLVLKNNLSRSPWQLVGVILGGVYGLGMLVLAIAGLFALSFTSIELARNIIVIGGTVLVVGWIMAPLVVSGVDQTLDPSRLATFPIPPRQLLMGLAVSGVLGVPGIITLLVTLGTTVAWWKYPLALVVAAITAVLGTLTCVIASRAVTALSAGLGANRRYREASGAIVLIPLILLGPIIISVTSGVQNAAEVLPRIASAVGWTPFGAVWTLPGDIAAGDWAGAAAHLVIALLTLAALTWLWSVSLKRALVNPPRESAATVKQGKLGFFSKLPATPTGAVAARALTYWLRDPRYSRSLMTIPLIVVLMVFYANIDKSNMFITFAGPLLALVLSLSIYADISYDGTAFALHLSSGVSGIADRAGRVIAVASFAVPVILLVTIGTIWYTNAWTNLPGMLAIALGITVTGFGVASVTSARMVFPVPAPGDSPFRSPPGAALPSSLAMFGSWGVIAILVIPEVVLAIISFVTQQVIYGWIALAVSVVLGSLFLVLGVRMGGKLLERRGPELLAQLRA